LLTTTKPKLSRKMPFQIFPCDMSSSDIGM